MKKGFWKKGFLLILVSILALLAACSGPKVTPTEVMDEALKALQEKKTDVFGQVLGYDGEGTYEEQVESLKAYAQEGEAAMSEEVADLYANVYVSKPHDFKYEILEEEVQGNNATLKLKLVCPDLETLEKELDESRWQAWYSEGIEEYSTLSRAEFSDIYFTQYAKWLDECDYTKEKELTVNMVYDRFRKSWTLPEDDYKALGRTILFDIYGEDAFDEFLEEDGVTTD